MKLRYPIMSHYSMNCSKMQYPGCGECPIGEIMILVV